MTSGYEATGPCPVPISLVGDATAAPLLWCAAGLPPVDVAGSRGQPISG